MSDEVTAWIRQWKNNKVEQLFLWWHPRRERLKDHQRALRLWAEKHDRWIVGVVLTIVYGGIYLAIG